MNGKLVLTFLLTITIIFSNALGQRAFDDFQTFDISNIHSEPAKPLVLSCKIVCRSHGTGKVCGSDGKTYDDIGFIECRQSCGENISKAYDGECIQQYEKKKYTFEDA